jgi:hypothetical protein
MWESPDCYDVMKSCCRSSAPGLPRKYRATTNPHGPGHHWVKLRFIDVAPRGVIVTDKYGNQRVALHGHWSENKHLLEADPDYVNRLLQATEDDPDQQAAWVDGSWDVAAGAYFGAVWSRKVHVLHAVRDPARLAHRSLVRLGRGEAVLDRLVGRVGWLARPGAEPGDARARAAHVRARLALAHRRVVRLPEGSAEHGPPSRRRRDRRGSSSCDRRRWGHAAHSSRARGLLDLRRPGRPLDRRELQEGGITWLPANKGPGSRKNGWQLMRERFGYAKRTPKENPGLYVFDTCLDFIRTVPMLPRDEKNPDDIDTKAEDHIADETRYRVLAPAAPRASVSTFSIHRRERGEARTPAHVGRCTNAIRRSRGERT